MTDKPMLSFAKVVSGKIGDEQSDLGLVETVSDVTAASGSTTIQTGMSQQLTTTNNSGIKSPNKESNAANAQGKRLDKSRDMPSDKGARSERTGRKKTGRQKEKRRAERGSKTEEEKGKSAGDGKGGKKPGEAHNGGTEQAHAQQTLALEPAPLPAVNAWFRNKDAIVDSAAASPKDTAPVQIQSPVDSKPLHGNNNSSGNGAQEHKHKQKPLDIKKANNKKDDQRTHDRKEAKSGHHQQHGKGREGREREKEAENRVNHNMQQTMTVAAEWPTLDAANSADEAMTNGNVQTEGQKEVADRSGVGMKQQHAGRTQQPSPHSETDDYNYPENAGGIYYKQGASQGWKKNAKGIKEVIHNHNTPSPLPLPLPLHFQSSIPHPLINGIHHHEEQLNFVTATSHPHSTNISTMDSVQNKEPNEVHASQRHNPSSGRDEKPSQQQQGINGTSGGQNAAGGNTGRGQQHNMANSQQTRSGGRDRDGGGRGQRHQGQNQKQHGPPSSGPINQRDYWHKKEHGGSSSSGPSGQSAPPPSLPTNQPPPVLQQPQHLISVGKPALQQPTAGHSSTPGGTQGNSADKQQPKPYYQNNDRSSQQQRVNPHAPPKLTPSQRKARGPLPDWDEIQDCEDTFDYMSLMDTQFAQFYPIHQSYDVAAAAAAVQAPQMGIMIQQATQHMAQFGYRPPLQMFPPVMAAAPATAAAPPPHSLPSADPSTTLAAAGGPSLVPPPVITSTTPTPILPTAMLSPQPLGQINTAIPFAPIYPSTMPPFAAMSEDSLKEYARKQIEYYFSDENLQKDFFLRRKMSPDGFLPLTLIASFPRVRSLTENRALILDALRDSEKIEISPDNQHIRTRINPTAWPLAPTVPMAADSPSSASALSSNMVTASPSAVVSPVNKQPPASTPAPAHSTTHASAPATVNANASVSTPQSVPSSSSAPPIAKSVEKDENKEQNEHPVDEAKPSSATGESHNEDEEEKWEQVSRKRKGKAARNEKPPQQQNEGGGGTQRSNEKGGGGQHNSSVGGSTRPRSKDDGSSGSGGVSSPS